MAAGLSGRALLLSKCELRKPGSEGIEGNAFWGKRTLGAGIEATASRKADIAA